MNHLVRTAALAWMAGLLPAAADSAPGPDMLRFANNDTLHGRFLSFGANDSILWKSPEAEEPIRFSTSKLHRVVLNRGQAHQPLGQQSNVRLSNGDVIPGTIVSADAKSVVLDTGHLGRLEIPREVAAAISPSPFGGKLLYYGPLNDKGWQTVAVAEVDSADEPQPKPKRKPKPTPAKAGKQDAPPKDWNLVGAAWYSGTDGSRYLVKKNAMPDSCRVSFKLAWRGSLYAKVALHADFKPSDYKHTSASQLDLAATTGRAYVLILSTHSASLYACGFDDNGKPQNSRLESNQFSLGISNEESADFELRIDRPRKNILLFVNGNFKGKWNLGREYIATGAHLGFHHRRYNQSEMRVSDVVITRWNGMKDSASSMQSADRDVILLNNGVDRFSGDFKTIRDGKVTFRGSYGNTMSIPLDEVGEIHLATDKVRKPEKKNDRSVGFYIYPHGRITGVPSQGANGKTKLLTGLLGEVALDTRYVNIIDFSRKNSLLDSWDDNF